MNIEGSNFMKNDRNVTLYFSTVTENASLFDVTPKMRKMQWLNNGKRWKTTKRLNSVIIGVMIRSSCNIMIIMTLRIEIVTLWHASYSCNYDNSNITLMISCPSLITPSTIIIESLITLFNCMRLYLILDNIELNLYIINL